MQIKRVTQVIVNLLNNAIKFTKEGTITVSTEVKDSNNTVVVSIKDTGQGIDQEVLPQLFTKFATRSPLHGVQTGTGLGLFISKSIIQAHGANIWAENNPDRKGATFYFTLPLLDKA